MGNEGVGNGKERSSELETHLLIAQRLGYSSDHAIEPILAQAREVRRITRGLLNSLRQQGTEPRS